MKTNLLFMLMLLSGFSLGQQTFKLEAQQKILGLNADFSIAYSGVGDVLEVNVLNSNAVVVAQKTATVGNEVEKIDSVFAIAYEGYKKVCLVTTSRKGADSLMVIAYHFDLQTSGLSKLGSFLVKSTVPLINLYPGTANSILLSVSASTGIRRFNHQVFSITTSGAIQALNTTPFESFPLSDLLYYQIRPIADSFQVVINDYGKLSSKMYNSDFSIASTAHEFGNPDGYNFCSALNLSVPGEDSIFCFRYCYSPSGVHAWDIQLLDNDFNVRQSMNHSFVGSEEPQFAINKKHVVSMKDGFYILQNITPGEPEYEINFYSYELEKKCTIMHAGSEGSVYSLIETNGSVYLRSEGETDVEYFRIDGCSISVGITEAEKENGVMLFPNPVKAAMVVRSNADVMGLSYLVVDMTGKSVQTGTFTNSNENTLPLHLTDGIYLLQYGSVSLRFVVKN